MASPTTKTRIAARKAPPKTRVQPVAAQPTGEQRTWLYLLPALVLGAAVFAQTVGFDFVNWDDDSNVLENRSVLTSDWLGIWTQTVIGNYNPLSITTLAVEYALVGADAWLSHLNNVLLHGVCVVLVYLLGLQLRLRPFAAGLLAVLFAVHPMRVESVAWVTERKDVLFGAFYFGALLWYQRYRSSDQARGSWHWGVAALFVLALSAKVQAVTLPLSMLCLDYLRRAALQQRDSWSAWQTEVLAKAPYLAMSLAVGIAGIYFLGSNGSLDGSFTYSALDRLAIGAYAFATYLAKAVWPYTMSPLYPYPSQLPWQAYASFSVVLAAIVGLVVGFRKGWVAPTFALAFFGVNVVFMLQVLGAGQGFLADRFTYVGYAGLFWGIAYGVQVLLSQKPALRVPLGVGLSVYVLLLTVTAYRQTKIWENGGTLWLHVTSIYPRSATAFGNRGQFLRKTGRIEEALVLYANAIAVSPNEGSYYNSRGKIYFDRGDDAAALADYSAGIAVEPDLAELYINRGALHARGARYALAETDIARGLELEPGDFNGLLNRSLLHYTTGNLNAALEDYDELLAQRPERHDLWQERGSIRVSLGDAAGGAADLRQALERAQTPEQRDRYRTILNSLPQR